MSLHRSVRIPIYMPARSSTTCTTYSCRVQERVSGINPILNIYAWHGRPVLSCLGMMIMMISVLIKFTFFVCSYDYIYLLHQQQQLNYTTTTNHHCTFPPQCPSTLLLLPLEAVWAFLYQDELGKAMSNDDAHRINTLLLEFMINKINDSCNVTQTEHSNRTI